MKKINILILCSILCFFYSCNGMLDGIQPYLDEGEKIYVGKLDSLKAFTGKNRIKIEGKMMYGVNQVKCVISYKDPITLEEKFKEFPIERTEPRETFEFMLENLTEGFKGEVYAVCGNCDFKMINPVERIVILNDKKI